MPYSVYYLTHDFLYFSWYDGFSTMYVGDDGLIYKHVADKVSVFAILFRICIVNVGFS